jgi:hypothetical protein
MKDKNLSMAKKDKTTNFKKVKRINVIVLGNVIGTAKEERESNRYHMYFTNFKRNKLGKKFVPDFIVGYDIYVDFKTSNVRMYSHLDTAGKWQKIESNWPLFFQNKKGVL